MQLPGGLESWAADWLRLEMRRMANISWRDISLAFSLAEASRRAGCAKWVCSVGALTGSSLFHPWSSASFSQKGLSAGFLITGRLSFPALPLIQSVSSLFLASTFPYSRVNTDFLGAIWPWPLWAFFLRAASLPNSGFWAPQVTSWPSLLCIKMKLLAKAMLGLCQGRETV